MSKSAIEAQKINSLITEGKTIQAIKMENSYDTTQWYNYSAKAYKINLENERQKRSENERDPHISTTSRNDVVSILELNELLANYALLIPVFSTMTDFKQVKTLASDLPLTEPQIIQLIGDLAMHPRLRVMQKKGRFEQFEYFKNFSKFIDAAVLSFYRANYISCYLTLVPVIEGVIIRWMGYKEHDLKPEFEDIRKFFKNTHVRQPSPWNIEFHDIYVRVCNKIINDHFYRPSTKGQAHEDFNRHVASHLLNDNKFANKKNCVRLFILIDAMAEIYFYESRRRDDPRFSLRNDEMERDIISFTEAMLATSISSPEQVVLNLH